MIALCEKQNKMLFVINGITDSSPNYYFESDIYNETVDLLHKTSVNDLFQ